MQLEDKLQDESDRSAFLIIGALIEGRLEKVILAKLKEGSVLNHFGSGSFNNRINLAYSLGLIDSSRKALYHKFREVRNKFAHSADFIDLSDVKIESVFSSHPSFGEELDNKVRAEAKRQDPEGMLNIDKFWTARRKFEFVFISEIRFLDSLAQSVERVA